METKEMKITPPEGYEIDRENSTFECIKFKKTEKNAWRYDKTVPIEGFYISESSECTFHAGYNEGYNYNLFATEKQAKSVLAMARISQIMANDERFGGVVTDEEWGDGHNKKYTIVREGNHVGKSYNQDFYKFLAFHTTKQRDLFLKENEDLIKDYLML